MPQKTAGDPALTPAMQQYQRFKAKHPGCVLFFRMGDFYEMFHEDAELAHRVLGVTLTQRTEGVPMAGVPYHAVEGYLRRMIQAGYRVAVCDQVEDAKQAQGVVKRDVTRVITPGTLTDESLLEEGVSRPLAAVAFLDAGGGPRGSRPGDGQGAGEDRVAAAWADVSTGAFELATFELDRAVDELARVGPSELLVCENTDGDLPQRGRAVAEALGCAAIGRPTWQFRRGEAFAALCKHYGVERLSGFGLDEDEPALAAAGAVLHYLLETQAPGEAGDPSRTPGQGADRPLSHLRPPRLHRPTDYMVLDRTTLRSLEIHETMRSGQSEGAVLSVFRGTATAMGKRTLRRWLGFPLLDRQAIEARHAAVGAMVDDERLRRELGDALSGVQDVERIAGRLGVRRALPRDLVALGRSVARGAAIAETLADRPSLRPWAARLDTLLEPLSSLAGEIDEACVESPPAHLREGGLFRDGYDAALDEARSLQRDANAWLARYQKRLAEETRIDSLKVGYNKVFGYYIEVTAANRAKVLDDQEPFRSWSRKQTLKNAERFITPELKEFESKVLSAESRAIDREQALFQQLGERCRAEHEAIRGFAEVVAELDALRGFARYAVRAACVRPEMTDEPVLAITGGRHPVLDLTLGEGFVPNDVSLGRRASVAERREGPAQPMGDGADGSPRPSPGGTAAATLALITGPNMAGKSTYIRQAALLTLLAHAGAFVPADRAVIGVCDRVFTRIGASDELHTGQSTFMVEMTETANLCHHATERSLVILDEIGRGTSTLDGLSLAWAIAEHLADRGCRTLFATHYHELTTLADERPNVANLHVTVREWGDEVVFLHRIVPGATDRSYGIHVAKIAGLPPQVVSRARALLARLAVQHEAAPPPPDAASMPSASRGASKRATAEAMPLFAAAEAPPHPVLEALREASLDAMTPLQAFDRIRQWQEQLRDELR